MKFSKKTYLSFIIAAIIFHFIIYFGYSSSYYDYKNIEHLPNFYQTNVYRFRILSYSFFEAFFNLLNPILEKLREISYFGKSMKTLGSNFYLSLFSFNTIFLIAFLWMLKKILGLINFKSLKTVFALQFCIILLFLILFSEFVLTPYDLSSYFFLLIGIYYSLQYVKKEQTKYLVFLCLLIFVSTFNRETSALNLSFFAALLFYKDKVSLESIKKNFWKLFFPICSFLAAYVFLRWYIGSSTVVQGNYLLSNIISIKNILGVLLFVLVLGYYNAINITKKFYVLHLYLLFTIPYLFTILFGGILWEFRLFIPIIISYGLLSIAKLKHE